MNIIRRKRKELGISQKELSEKLGTSQQTISRIEKADIENIPCSLLVKLANIFDIPIDVLYMEIIVICVKVKLKNYGMFFKS